MENMEIAWRIRFMLVIILGLIFISDLIGYQSVKGVKLAKKKSTFLENHQQNVDVYENLNEISTLDEKTSETTASRNSKFTTTIREHCLPKMLCEMASKLPYELTEKEYEILHLLHSTSMTLAINSPPSKWHFAAHMGQLLRYTDNSAAMGCAYLWPQCPFSSKKLLGITNNINLH